MKYTYIKTRILQIASMILIGSAFVACSLDKQNAVVPKPLEQYKAELNTLVTQEKAKVQTTIEGYNKGDFKPSQYFSEYAFDYMAVIMEAQAVLDDPEITIEKIIEANYKLSGPGKLYNDLIFQSDRRELNDLIGVSDTLYVHTPAGTEPGMAPEEARGIFKTDINEAKSVRDRMTSIDRQLNEEVDSLTISLEVFKAAIIK